MPPRALQPRPLITGRGFLDNSDLLSWQACWPSPRSLPSHLR